MVWMLLHLCKTICCSGIQNISYIRAHITPTETLHIVQQIRYLSFDVPLHHLTRKTSRSSAPGGQSVNKSESKVQLAFNVEKAGWLPPHIKTALRNKYGNKISKGNVFQIECQDTSSQTENYSLCVKRLRVILEEAETESKRLQKDAVKPSFKEILRKIKTPAQVVQMRLKESTKIRAYEDKRIKEKRYRSQEKKSVTKEDFS